MDRMLEPAEFLAAIQAAAVLPPDRERNLLAWAKALNADTPSIARHLHEQAWLTPYQIQRIHKGKGHKLTVGQYVLQDILGEGSMGRVFRARHTRLNRDMALKVIRKDRLSNPRVRLRFEQEMRACGQLVHPNIVLAIDAGTAGLVHFVAMELIDGMDLKTLVATHGPMPMPVACEYVRQAAVGLQHAFEQRMVHRDVKPSNLMVTKAGVVKVLDLGLAMLNEPDSIEAKATVEGTILGTPDYLAPEQAQDSTHVDTRADIYSLGGTLFYLLTGHVPYEGSNAAAKLVRHATDPPPSVRKHRPDLPPELDGLIQWLMAKRPEARPQTPLQAAAALQPFCVPPPPTSQPTLRQSAAPSDSQAFEIPEDAPSRRRKRRPSGGYLFLLAALLTLPVAVFLAWLALKRMR